MDEYFKYLLDDRSYMGEDMFVMHHIGGVNLVPNVDFDIMIAYNKMHVGSYFVFYFLF
jgi:hypothetical protein